MAIRQIRKHSRKQSRKNKVIQRGGDTGHFVLPPSYFGKGMNGYYADGSNELKGNSRQHAVSRGSVSADGKWAGPNLYPLMGGNCGCSTRRYKKSKTQKRGHSMKK